MRGLVLLALTASLASAQTLIPDGNGFRWQAGDQYIRLADGRFTAGIADGRSVSWWTMLWHDAYVYETLGGGAVEAGPTLQADGSVTQSGTFSAREGSAPMKYTMTLIPAPEGVRVRMEFAKSAVLKLCSGIWLHVTADKETYSGTERVWADPSWHGTVSTGASGAGKRFLMELAGARSLSLTPEGFREMQKDTYGGPNLTYRFNLLPDDFAVEEKVAAEYLISFADMPETFPGEVKPLQAPLALKAVTPSATQVSLYEKLELTADLTATYDNPYDPDDVALDAVFSAPSGKRLAVPGFFMLREKREVADGAEVMTPEGNGEWRVRFAPAEAGKYTYRLTLRDRSGTVTGGEGSFECAGGESKGFLRTSKVDPHYLAFDNGAGYFAVGHNLPIYHTTGQIGDEGMRRFAAAKENYNRWWMCSYGFGIEWGGKLGWYRQDAAARIDLCMDVARELGLYYMMCMDTHQDFREGGWESNPFNARNGGPCANAGEWFTNETAKALYKKRLRYTVARWGYSPNVLCWEFGNEFEGWADSPDTIKLPWHREMSDFLRGLDPFGHLITTSFWGHTGPPEFWQLPNLDIVQTHLYTNSDENVAEVVNRLSLKQWREFDKPHIFGEFGIDSRGGFEESDPQGWGIHNSLWAGLASFCAGGPMPWWHENYIEPFDLYFHFTAIANFAEGLPFGTQKWEPLETSAPEFLDKTRAPETRDATVIPLSRWGKPEANEFRLLPDGTLAGDQKPQALLQGEGHRDLKNEPTFVASFPRAGRFTIRVGTVSNSGLLRVWVDDAQVLEKEFPCADGLGKASVWREEWKLWEVTYDEEVSVDIPAGERRIRVENFGKDWIGVKGYVFEGCKVLDTPNLLLCGMKTDGLALLWVQNRDSDWKGRLDKRVSPVDPCTVTLSGLADGPCEVEWWETWKGSVARVEQAEVRGGKLVLALPELDADVAVKVRRK